MENVNEKLKSLLLRNGWREVLGELYNLGKFDSEVSAVTKKEVLKYIGISFDRSGRPYQGSRLS